MTERIEIRESQPSDLAALEELYPAAFPEEDLLPLVRQLLDEVESVVSLVATADQTLTGHAVFTTCGIVGRVDRVALLGPLAVAPQWQRQGIGSTLVRTGLQRLEDAGTQQVYVLGDPAYYSRFGFETDDGVDPPYPLPDEWRGAWQSLNLAINNAPIRGQLSVPQPWRQQALWSS